MTDLAVSVSDLTHCYGELTAVDGLSLDVEKGKLVSLLGPNGAGKTTMMKVLVTLLPLQKGKVAISGHDLERERDEVRSSIGIVFQEVTLDSELTVWETMEFHGRIYGMEKEARRKRIDELLKVVELDEKKDVVVEKLSGGMKRRLEVARGLLTSPTVLFLDEPTTGLDPQTRLHIWEQIARVRDGGTTIVLSTHNMEEADRLSDEICIIDHGKLLVRGTPDELKTSLGGNVILLSTNDDRRAEQFLKELSSVGDVKSTSSGLAISVNAEGSQLLPRLLSGLNDSSVEVLSVQLKKPTLDDVFIHYTGRGLREGAEDSGATAGSKEVGR